MPNQKLREWTVFFLLKSVEGEISHAIEMINELRRIQLGDQISVVLCLNVFVEDIRAIEEGDPFEIEERRDKVKTTVFYLLTPASGIRGFVNKLTEIARKNDFDLTDPGHLRDFFRKEVVVRCAANRYMLFTWDHGNGYAIFRNLDKKRNETIVPAYIPLNPHTILEERHRVMYYNLPKLGVNGDIKVLTMDELSNALQCAFGESKLEMVVMMNCNMQLVDAGYALKNAVKYLVAPESSMDFDGFNYTFIFRILARAPKIKTGQLVRHVVESFECKVYFDLADGVEARSTTALFANNLSFYSRLASALDELALAIEKELPARKPELLMARASMIPIDARTFQIDLSYLLRNLRMVLGHNWHKKLIDRIQGLLNELTIASYIGKAFESFESGKPSGVSVFFPFVLDGIPIQRERLETYRDSSFSTEKNWFRVVMKFATNNETN